MKRTALMHAMFLILEPEAPRGSGLLVLEPLQRCHTNWYFILCARRQANLEALKADILSGFPDAEILILKLDVSDGNEVHRALSTLPPEFAQIDVLVNNAGLALGLERILDGIPNKTIDTVLDTNVKGVMYVTREILPQMIQRGAPGHIIMIGSIAGIEAYPRGSLYCASKHAVHAIAESLRKEVVAYPICVTEIQPGLVETEFSLVRFNGDVQEAKKVYLGIEPLIAKDIADAVVFVATRRPGVQIASMLILPTHQASTRDIHRIQ